MGIIDFFDHAQTEVGINAVMHFDYNIESPATVVLREGSGGEAASERRDDRSAPLSL